MYYLRLRSRLEKGSLVLIILVLFIYMSSTFCVWQLQGVRFLATVLALTIIGIFICRIDQLARAVNEYPGFPSPTVIFTITV